MRRQYDSDGWPVVSGDDLRAFIGLIAFAVIFVAICAVGR